MKRPKLSSIFKIALTLGLFSLIYKTQGVNEKIKYLPNIPEDDSVIVINGKGPKVEFEQIKDISLIIWNSYKAKRKGFFDDLNKLSNIADVILLQEYYPSKEFLENIKLNPVTEAVSAISFYNRKEIPTGVCTLSTVEHAKVNFIRSEHREPVLKTPKMVLITEYKVKNYEKPLTIVNVHGINFVSKSKFERQINQILEIIKEADGPIIVGGDFNVWSKKRENILKNSILLNNFQEVKINDDKRRLKLDRIYVKGITVNYSRILTNINSSDHKPIHIKFSL